MDGFNSILPLPAPSGASDRVASLQGLQSSKNHLVLALRLRHLVAFVLQGTVPKMPKKWRPWTHKGSHWVLLLLSCKFMDIAWEPGATRKGESEKTSGIVFLARSLKTQRLCNGGKFEQAPFSDS